MLRFLQDIARTAANYLQPATQDISHGGEASAHTSSSSYIDKYCTTPYRNFSRQKFGTDTWETIQEIQQKAHRVIVGERPLSELQVLLESCPHVAEVINIRDMLGYNLLQYSIIANRMEIVRYLILKGADLNLPTCARPLHLAAKVGHSKIVVLLLECGADPDVMSCVCFPESHILQRTMFMSDSDCWSVACFGDIYAQDKVFRVQFEYPLYFAIMSDSIECVQLLMDHGATQLSSRSPKLHTACAFGSFCCVRHFLKVKPSDLDQEDQKGLYPLQYAVQWGKKFTEYLVLKGALVTIKTHHRESLLILLYNQSSFIHGLAETTSYLLDCGLRMMINAVDAGGNSPLHTLFKKLQKNPPLWTSEDEAKHDNFKDDVKEAEHSRSLCYALSRSCQKSMEAKLQASWDTSRKQLGSGLPGFFKDVALTAEEKEYLDSAVILLRAGANTNMANKVGNTCLHELLRIQVPDPLKVINPRRPHHCSLRLIYCLLSALFEHGANPRFINNMHTTIHGSLITTGTDAVFHQDSAEPLSVASPTELEYLIKCVWLLKDHGCYFGGNCATVPLQHILAKLDFIQRLDAHPHLSAEQKSDLASTFAAQIMQVLEAILGCGVYPADLQGLYYQLMNHYPILPIPFMKSSVLLFLHYGADPNVGGVHIPMSVLHSQSSHSHCPVYPLLHILNLLGRETSGDSEPEPGLLELFDVFFNAMDQSGAKQCMFHYLCYDLDQGAPKTQPKALVDQVQSIIATPRRLRQITAQFVYIKLCNRLRAKVKCLPLPNSVKTLILSMQY